MYVDLGNDMRDFPLSDFALLWALAPRVCVCLSLQMVFLNLSLSFLQSLWLSVWGHMTCLTSSTFLLQETKYCWISSILVSSLLACSSSTLIDLAARHQITQFCPSPLNYLDAASYANDVLYRISLFLFSLSRSLSLFRRLYALTHQTTSSLVGFDTWRVGGWSTLPLCDPSSPCMCSSIKPRLLESDPASSPFTSSKTLRWFPSNSCKPCSHFHCISLLPSYASLDTTAAFDCRTDSWCLISGAGLIDYSPGDVAFR